MRYIVKKDMMATERRSYKRIRSGSGLGDNLYMQSVVRYLLKKDEALQVCTHFPEIFTPMADRIKFAIFSRQDIDIIAHYTNRKGKPGSSQFQDICMNIGLGPDVELKIDWIVKNQALVNNIKKNAKGKKILCAMMPRTPMGRSDGFGRELLPDLKRLEEMVNAIKEMHDCYLILTGKGVNLRRFKNIDLDMSNQTNIFDLMDIASTSDIFTGQVSSIIPIAESFLKPCIVMFSHQGLNSKTEFVKQITPEKVLHYKTSVYCVDDWNIDQIKNVVEKINV